MGIEIVFLIVLGSFALAGVCGVFFGTREILGASAENRAPARPPIALAPSTFFLSDEPTVDAGDPCGHRGRPSAPDAAVDPARLRAVLASEVQRQVSRELSASARFVQDPRFDRLHDNDLIQ